MLMEEMAQETLIHRLQRERKTSLIILFQKIQGRWWLKSEHVMNKLGKVITNTNSGGDRKTEEGRLKINWTDVFLGAKKGFVSKATKSIQLLFLYYLMGFTEDLVWILQCLQFTINIWQNIWAKPHNPTGLQFLRLWIPISIWSVPE